MTPPEPVILAAVLDFTLHLMNRPNPLVLGANYPRKTVIEEFEKWAATRKLKTHFIDMQEFHRLCDK